MPWDLSSGDARRADRGSALVIVLLFVILLTGLTIAFLSRSLTAQKVSASSASETKVNLLANSAGDIIIGDLKQEIVAGSTTMAASTVNWPLYTPNANATMIPFQNGVPITGTLIPNMISRSVRPGNTAGASPYVPYTASYTAAAVPPNRAADDTTTPAKVSTTTQSLNGRFISNAQWNSHYLVPRDPTVNAAGSMNTDSTPVSTFVAPDWVVVTRNGANSVSWNANLIDATITNTGYAVGRYAYAVYNEGGLLDMNVAGFPYDPANPGAAGSNGLTLAQASGKGSLALADLTQLNAGGALTQAKINNLVGWRNYATAQLSAANGTYGGFAFTPATSANWLTNFVLTNTNGFMKTIAPAGVTTPPSDQAFLSRQQLISLAQSLSISPDFLQYMGTFSRSLEQPSFVPDPNRPLVINSATPPPALATADSYAGNNDYVNKDATVNSAFLARRVTTAAGFSRYDGTTPALGEPLVKKKFPLSRLAWVAYNATNTAASSDKIYANFGLSRSSNTSAWIYNHQSTAAIPASSILTLSQVAVAKRDPDFAELLKATITAGSVGKGGPNRHNGEGNFQYAVDTTSDAQILQIMANLIDQQDPDSYPTRIQFKDSGLNTLSPPIITISGVEDLPYFYRWHLFSVVDTLPSTVISKSSSVTLPAPSGSSTLTTSFPGQNFPAGTNLGSNYTKTLAAGGTITGCAKVNGTTIKTITTAAGQGSETYLMVMDVWNPHDPNVTINAATRPTKFRIYVVEWDPFSPTAAVALSNTWKIGAESRFDSSVDAFIPENDGLNPPTKYYNPISASAANTTASTAINALTFSDNGGKLFREPTLLWNNNPTGLSLVGPFVNDANTQQKYYGVIVGKAALSQQFVISSIPANGALDGTYIVQAQQAIMTYSTTTAATSFWQCTAFVQYQDPLDGTGNTWQTYDAKYFDFHNNFSTGLVVNTADYGDGSWQSPIKNSQFQCIGTCMDPRTDRWGVGDNCPMGTYANAGAADGGKTTYALEPLANTAIGASNYSGIKTNYFSVVEPQRARADPGDVVYYSNPCASNDPGRNQQMRWFSPVEYRAGSGTPSSPVEFDGMFSQNNPSISSALLSQNRTSVDSIYYEDPDGVARRASGSYTDTSLTDDATPANTSQAATSTKRTGMPIATASTLDNKGVATPTSQSQARPTVLNRAFRNVSEMSYAFRGTPWKNIDFFNPESGDSALLDTFCVNELPLNPLVAGKIDLNTRNAPVLQAVVAGAYQDEYKNATTPPAYALPPITGAEAAKVATTLTGITTDTTHAWRGPLQNISGLVGRYVASPGTTTGYSDFYTYVPPNPVTGQVTSATYAGLSSALDCSQINGVANHVYSSSSAPLIQRFRESAIRPLADAGQVRVWNLLIDLVVQTGRYPKTATGLDQFMVDGQKRVWLHVAIDRFTGQVLDKQVEVVSP